MNTTTRRHPRTLSEAFNDASRAASIEIPRRRINWWRIADVLFATALGVIGAVVLVYGWAL